MNIPVVSSPPWYFRAAQQWNLNGKRGGVFLLRKLRALGLLNACSWFRIDGSEQILIPLYWAYTWGHASLEDYETHAIELFAECIERMQRDVVLIDCGADVGIYLRRVLSRSPQIRKVVAYEPNQASASVLRRNVETLNIETTVNNAAVSNFTGRGKLQQHRSRHETHAWYITPDDNGDVTVQTIDDLEVSPTHGLALKIDVEGGELSVLEGAKNAIRMAPSFVIQFEAHPEVAARTGIDPIECVRFVQSLRKCACVVSEDRTRSVSASTDFFQQFSRDKVYNIILYTPGNTISPT